MKKILTFFSLLCLNVVALQAQQYCATTSEHPWEYWMAYFGFNEIDNVSDKCHNLSCGYSDFTELSTDVTQGETYEMVVTPGFSYFHMDLFFRVWIDFNQDGDFNDANETVMSVIVPAGSNGQIGNFEVEDVTIPEDALLGSTRVRASMNWFYYPGPCENPERGEVEDYSINILERNPPFTDGPDLTMEDLEVPATTSVGEKVEYTFDLKNIGTKLAEGDFNIRSYFSTDNSLSADDAFDGLILTGNIGSGSTYDDVLGASKVPTIPAGDYFLILKVDADEVITELNENNNVISQPIRIVEASTEPMDYCEVEVDFPWHEWISFMRLGDNINNISEKSSYSDFTEFGPSVVTQGGELTFNYAVTYSYYTFREVITFYVDFNGDGIFDESEADYYLINAPTPGSDVTKIGSGSIPIPLDAKLGTTRVRVVLSREDAADPCGSVAFGEVEDYEIIIAEEQNSVPRLKPATDLFKIMPNPTSEYLTVQSTVLPGKFTLSIYNTLGRQVFSTSYEDYTSTSITLPIDHLLSGAYFVELSGIGMKPKGGIVMIVNTQ